MQSESGPELLRVIFLVVVQLIARLTELSFLIAEHGPDVDTKINSDAYYEDVESYYGIQLINITH